MSDTLTTKTTWPLRAYFKNWSAYSNFMSKTRSEYIATQTEVDNDNFLNYVMSKYGVKIQWESGIFEHTITDEKLFSFFLLRWT